MCTGAEVIAIVGALSAAGSAGVSISQAVSGGPSTPKGPSPSDLLQQQEAQTQKTERALIPSQLADAAARSGGGISPQFLGNLVGGQAGSPGGLDVLDEIRKSLNVSA